MEALTNKILKTMASAVRLSYGEHKKIWNFCMMATPQGLITLACVKFPNRAETTGCVSLRNKIEKLCTFTWTLVALFTVL